MIGSTSIFIHDVNKVYVSKTTNNIDQEKYGVIKLLIEHDGKRTEIHLFGTAEIKLEPEPKPNLEPLWVPNLEEV